MKISSVSGMVKFGHEGRFRAFGGYSLEFFMHLQITQMEDLKPADNYQHCIVSYLSISYKLKSLMCEH